jgi:hypothetical protein
VILIAAVCALFFVKPAHLGGASHGAPSGEQAGAPAPVPAAEQLLATPNGADADVPHRRRSASVSASRYFVRRSMSSA